MSSAFNIQGGRRVTIDRCISEGHDFSITAKNAIDVHVKNHVSRDQNGVYFDNTSGSVVDSKFYGLGGQPMSSLPCMPRGKEKIAEAIKDLPFGEQEKINSIINELFSTGDPNQRASAWGMLVEKTSQYSSIFSLIHSVIVSAVR